jgi:Redoxin
MPFIVSILCTVLISTAAHGAHRKPVFQGPPPPPQPTPSGQVLVRPRIAGEFIYDATVKNIKGESIGLGSVIENKFSIVVFSKPEHISLERARGYFKRLAPFIRDLGYQIVLVTTKKDDYVTEIAGRLKDEAGAVLLDESQQAFVAMGLADRPSKDDAAINAIFVVAPNKQIMFSFASVSDSIPFSGEVLVLAARVYRDAYQTPLKTLEQKPEKGAESK